MENKSQLFTSNFSSPGVDNKGMVSTSNSSSSTVMEPRGGVEHTAPYSLPATVFDEVSSPLYSTAL